jgi:catechol 2,3-dioxygenase-like lactoylglutathione lyase family enzyme
MFADFDAIATVAAKDLARARTFYESTLGLKVSHTEGDELVTYRCGHTSLNVYRSQFAGTNKATAVAWMVSNVPELVVWLKAKGVAFEHYDMQGMTRDGDVHSGNGMKIAWFKDPDGNILNIISA